MQMKSREQGVHDDKAHTDKECNLLDSDLSNRSWCMAVKENARLGAYRIAERNHSSSLRTKVEHRFQVMNCQLAGARIDTRDLPKAFGSNRHCLR